MTHSTEQERAEFEALFKSDENLQVFLDQNDISEEDAPLYFAAAFFGWQAARRAQVVPVWYVPVTASMGTVQRATEDGWNECVAAMLAAAPQPPEAGLMSEKRTTKPEAAPVQMPEAFAVIRFERSSPGKENEMPRVISCNWLTDGEYRVYTEHQVRQLLDAAPQCHLTNAINGCTNRCSVASTSSNKHFAAPSGAAYKSQGFTA